MAREFSHRPIVQGWFIGGMFAGAIAIGSWNLLALLKPSPLEVTEIRTSIEDDVWKVEMDVTATDFCKTAEVDRRFLPEGGESRYQKPVESYIEGTGARPYTVILEPGKIPSWHKYKITPGEEGVHVVKVTVFDCDSGFKGEAGEWSVRYQW